MALPGRIRKDRGEDLTTPSTKDAPTIDPLDILTDNCRLHYVLVGETKVEYIPLSISEEQQFLASKSAGDDEETKDINQLSWMLAKALIFRERSGLFDKESVVEQGLIRRSYFDATKEMVLSLPPAFVMELIKAIHQQRMDLIEKLEKLSEYKEKEKFKSESHGMPRDKGPMDEHVSFYYLTKDGIFKASELANLTRLQYSYFILLQAEANQRSSNDHEYMSRAAKSQTGGKGSKSSKSKTVGAG